MPNGITSVLIPLILSAALITACKPNDSGGGGTAANKPPYQSNNDEGIITGVIMFQGEPPAPRRIDMTKDPNCLSAGDGAFNNDLVVSDGKLANVFVYLKGGPAEQFRFAVPSAPAVLDQKGCRYEPRVLGLQAGQTLRVLNSDPTGHNVQTVPKLNRGWNESQVAGAPALEKTFPTPETLIPVKCNVHPWMRASVGVLAHPFFAVSAGDGSYTIKNVPPGEYTLVAWHETKGEQTQRVTVGPKEAEAQNFTFSAEQAYAPGSLRVGQALLLP